MGILSAVFGKKNPSDRRAQIEEHEARVREINDKLSNMIKKIAELQTLQKGLFPLYDAASGATRKTYMVKIRDLQDRIDGLTETRELYERNLQKEQLIIRKLEFVQEVGNTKIDADEIEDLMEDVSDANLELQVEDQSLNELGNSNYVRKKNPPRQSVGQRPSLQTGRTANHDSASDGVVAPEADPDEMDIEQLRSELFQNEDEEGDEEKQEQ